MSGQTSGQISGQQVRIGIRYCGGCNPVYDRVKAAHRLKEGFPWIDFTASCQGTDAACILCGCQSACAQTGDIKGVKIFICSEEDVRRAQERIAALFPEESGRQEKK